MPGSQPFQSSFTAPDSAPANQTLALIAEIGAVAVCLKQRADLPLAEHAILEIIERAGPSTVPQIARERSTTRQNVQVLVDRLRLKNRVTLSQNPVHRKSALVCLTEQGRQWLDVSKRGRAELLHGMGLALSPAEIAEAVEVLRKVHLFLASGHQPAKSISDSRPRSVRSEPSEAKKPTQPQTEEFPVSLL